MKNLGTLLLAIWLIAWGLKNAIGLSFHYDYLVLGVLAIVAGVLLILKR
jgi:hypothetical protein